MGDCACLLLLLWCTRAAGVSLPFHRQGGHPWATDSIRSRSECERAGRTCHARWMCGRSCGYGHWGGAASRFFSPAQALLTATMCHTHAPSVRGHNLPAPPQGALAPCLASIQLPFAATFQAHPTSGHPPTPLGRPPDPAQAACVGLGGSGQHASPRRPGHPPAPGTRGPATHRRGDPAVVASDGRWGVAHCGCTATWLGGAPVLGGTAPGLGLHRVGALSLCAE